jgi:prophage regulatory protein
MIIDAVLRTGDPLRLMGAHEIRMLLGGITRQRVYQLTTRPTFPEPVADLSQGKVWLATEVEEWVANRRPNHRPPADSAP